MRRREFMALVPAALMLAACSSDSTGNGGTPPPPPPPPPPVPPPAGADVTVNMDNIQFIDPDGNVNQNASVTIDAGQTVGWTNNDDVDHTVTSTSVPTGAQAFDSGFVSPGQAHTETFDVTGTYTYRCDVHPGIMFDATIIVQ